MSAASKLVVVYVLEKYHQRSQTFVDGEIQQLRRIGHEVHVVAVRRGQEYRTQDPLVVYLESAGIGKQSTVVEHATWLARRPLRYLRFLARVWRLRSERTGLPPTKIPWVRLPRVARNLERAGVGVIHAHFAWTGAAVAAALAALMDLPWSMTVHANDIFSDRRNLPAKLEMVSRVITVCEYNRDWLNRNTQLRAPVDVLTCGVQPPHPTGDGASTVDIVTVARLVEKKGVDLVVRAVAELARAGVRPTVEIIGTGPLRASLETLSTELGVAELITFTGPAKHDEALARIAAARLLCLPCRVAPSGDRDAMPTAIIEAMMAGVPVVSTREVGIPEMVDETCGRLVEPEDVVGLTTAIREILGDPELGRRLGAAGAARARERYTVEGQVDRLAEIFAQGIGG